MAKKVVEKEEAKEKVVKATEEKLVPVKDAQGRTWLTDSTGKRHKRVA